MSDPTNEAPTPNAVAMPPELFQAVRQTLGGLPHDQVRGLLNQLDQSVKAITLPEPETTE